MQDYLIENKEKTGLKNWLTHAAVIVFGEFFGHG